MLREITDALEALSSETPLVIALEDLHWSDPSTVAALASVASRTTPARLILEMPQNPNGSNGLGRFWWPSKGGTNSFSAVATLRFV
jgi:hypothetical protein